MKTLPIRSLPAQPQGIEKLQAANARLAILKRFILLCSAIVTTGAFGQVTYTWGGATDGTNIVTAGNWTPAGGPPSGSTGDTGQWDGVAPGNLTIVQTATALPGTGFGTSGVNWNLTANQTGSVNIISSVSSSPTIAPSNIANNSPSAALIMGNTSANVLNLIWRPGNADQVHDLVNNSSSANVIMSNVRLQSGGGAVHILLFDGSGNWQVTNNLNCANNAGTIIQKTGSGTLFWNGPSIGAAMGNSTINSPITIGAGAIVLQNNTVLSPAGVGNTGSQAIQNGGSLFEYDAPSESQTLTGAISGGGALQVNNGTLILSGANNYSGNNILSGGEVIANSAENPGFSGPLGSGNTISFSGGTLGYSVNNTYDYSSRFSTAASQAFKIDTAGQNIAFTNAAGLSSLGGSLTKLGSGTLTLAGANSYSGSTTVSAGKLLFQGTLAGSGNIAVANSTALGVTENGSQITPATLAVGTSASATLEFNSVTSTTLAPIAAGTVTAGGPITMNVNSGSFTIGQRYPLLTWTTGVAPAVTLGTLTGAGGTLSTNGNTIQLNVTSLAFVWTGIGSGSWDTTTANNWKVNGAPQPWANGGSALFDDTATGQTNITLAVPITPSSVTVNNNLLLYGIASSVADHITGAGSLTKNGNSTLTLIGGANDYTGVTAVNGGIATVGTLANGGTASDIGAANNSAASLSLNGGTLQYTGGTASSDHLFSLGTSGGTIDSSGTGALTLNNAGAVALTGTGARTLTLTGSDIIGDTLAAWLSDNGGTTALTKSGAGMWIVTGTNSNSGVTTVEGGTLQVGAGGNSSLGSGNIVDDSSLIYDAANTATNGTISGTGSVTQNGTGTIILPGNNSYSGGTTISSGTLQIGNGGATGTLNSGVGVVDNGTFIFNSTGAFTIAGGGVISGSGKVIVSGAGGLLKAIGANTYTGWTTINPGATFQPSEGNQGALASLIVTNNGNFKLVRQDNGIFIYSGNIVGSGALVEDANNANVGDVTLTGSNTYSGGTVICDNTLILGDGATAGAGTIAGNVLFSNTITANDNPRSLVFNHPENYTFPGNIIYSTNLPFGNRGIVAQMTASTLTLTGTNTYPGGTEISNGVVQVGAGGNSGGIGSGPVTDNGVLVFDLASPLNFGGVISGTGSVVQEGTGALTLTATNIYFGTMTVSNGTLLINGQDFALTTSVIAGTLGGSGALNGAVTMNAGTTLSPGAVVATPTTLTINSSLSFGGNLAFNVNKSLAVSNDEVVVTGSLNNTGTGTLTVVNDGPGLSVGDKFTLFSQPVVNGAALSVTGAGATWANNLATDGSITALTVSATVNTNPPSLRVSVSGNTLSLAWPTNLGWTLQTNSVGLAATNQWFRYPGTSTITNINLGINPAKTNVFFRMVYP